MGEKPPVQKALTLEPVAVFVGGGEKMTLEAEDNCAIGSNMDTQAGDGCSR